MEGSADVPPDYSPPPPPLPHHRHSYTHPPPILSRPINPHGHSDQRRLSDPHHRPSNPSPPPVLVRRLPLPPLPSPHSQPKKGLSSPALPHVEHPLPPKPPRPSCSSPVADLPPKAGGSTPVVKVPQHGGYDYKFTEEVPEDFLCSAICTKVLRDPQLTDCCGQHFCQSCLQYWFTRNKKESCPHCREEKFTYMADKPLRRRIDALRICCTKVEAGCDWIGELSSLSTHLESETGCGYVEAACPNKCGEELNRKDLANHLATHCPLRVYQCWHCEAQGTYRSITEEHYKECKNYPLKCPNGCGEGEIPRAKMDQHRSKCSLEPVQCPFSEAGCDVSPMRKDLNFHMAKNTQKHLQSVMNAFQLLKKQSEEEIQELKKELQRSNLETQTLKSQIQSLNKESRVMGRNTAIVVDCLREACTPNQMKSLQSVKRSRVLRKPGDKIVFTIRNMSHYSDGKEDWHSPFFYYKDYDVQLRVSIVRKDDSRNSFSISFAIHIDEEPLKQGYETVCSDSVKINFEYADDRIYNAIVSIPIKSVITESKDWHSVTPIKDSLSFTVRF